jgi:nitric oxide reductase NorD protein
VTPFPPGNAAENLETLRDSLHVFFRALAGPPAEGGPEDVLADLPVAVEVFPNRQDNRGWYLVAVAHRAGHVEYGTHSDVEDFAQPSTRALFHLLEDCRVDELLKYHYPGLRSMFMSVQAAELRDRPPAAVLPPPLAPYEALVQLSLGVPAESLGNTSPEILRAVASARAPGARVADVVAATRRIGAALAAEEQTDVLWWELLPGVSYRESTSTLFRSERDAASDAQAHATDAGERADHPFQEVEQQLLPPDEQAAPDEGDPDQFLEEDSDFGTLAQGENGQALQPVGSNAATSVEAPAAPRPFLYPEWDFRARRYRRDWCAVYERFPLSAMTVHALRETLTTYADLLPHIRRHLEHIVPDGYRLVRRVEHGSDLDLDASLEALIDLRAGIAPSERVEARRERGRRDIAVAFLLDLSASTAEYLKAPPNARPRYSHAQRIIDVERQCVALLLGAMEKLGDAYAIYGFSGSGPEYVDFLVIKDLQEQLSNEVAGRVAAIEPIRGTRMGAAIRHTTHKLRGAEARTKLLLLISDGRPYDNDYGVEYGIRGRLDYAMHDTRVALDEARRAGLRPFLLTVDQNGADYLREMCGAANYEVLSDVETLPERVLALYGELVRR